MGFTSYSCDSRTLRATACNYSSGDVKTIFTQQTKRCVHDSMSSKGISLRECRDSEIHPFTVPIILALDVTGSMGDIPMMMIAEGLPKLMSTIIERGTKDASLLFLAIGDHECDRYPVQVGQFESGDAELDMWLTRTYLEGGGGGNGGESYPLAWEFAANRVKTDAWEKRKEKGFLFTIGDEPFLDTFPQRCFKEIYNDELCENSQSLTAADLYKKAYEKYHVIHISVDHSYRAPDKMWTELMGNNHVIVKDYNDIPAIIAETIIKNVSLMHSANNMKPEVKQAPGVETDIRDDDAVPAML